MTMFFNIFVLDEENPEEVEELVLDVTPKDFEPPSGEL